VINRSLKGIDSKELKKLFTDKITPALKEFFTKRSTSLHIYFHPQYNNNQDVLSVFAVILPLISRRMGVEDQGA
jgi:hypothetical protein